MGARVGTLWKGFTGGCAPAEGLGLMMADGEHHARLRSIIGLRGQDRCQGWRWGEFALGLSSQYTAGVWSEVHECRIPARVPLHAAVRDLGLRALLPMGAEAAVCPTGGTRAG